MSICFRSLPGLMLALELCLSCRTDLFDESAQSKLVRNRGDGKCQAHRTIRRDEAVAYLIPQNSRSEQAASCADGGRFALPELLARLDI